MWFTCTITFVGSMTENKALALHYAASTVVSAVSGLAGVPLLAHTFGPLTWSSLALAQLLGGYAALVVAGGWSVVGPGTLAEIPEQDRPRFFAQLARQRRLVVPAAASSAAVAAALLGHLNFVSIVVAVGFSLAAASNGWLLISERMGKAFLWCETAPRAGGVFAGALAAALADMPLLYGIGVIVGYGAAPLASRAALQRRWPSAPAAPADFHQLRPSSQVKASVIVIAAATYTVFPPLLAQMLPGASAAVVLLGDRLLRLATTALQPLMQFAQSRTSAVAQDKVEREFLRLMRWLTPTLLGAAAAFATGSVTAGRLLSAGTIAVPVSVSIVAGGVLISAALSQLLGSALLARTGRATAIMWSAIAGATCALLFAVPLISHFGTVGVFIVILLAESVVLVVQLAAAVGSLRAPVERVDP